MKKISVEAILQKYEAKSKSAPAFARAPPQNKIKIKGVCTPVKPLSCPAFTPALSSAKAKLYGFEKLTAINW